MNNHAYRVLAILVTSGTLIGPDAAIAQQVNHASERTGGDVSVGAAAQQNVPPKAQEAEASVERTVKRFGLGAEAGVGIRAAGDRVRRARYLWPGV
jgi:hypothetical protein